MKIVIDIPNRYYEMLKDFNFEIIADRCKYKTIQVQVINAIKNGTPLPEHHGRLKDIDWIDENCKNHYSDIDGSWCYAWRDIDEAPTIIEGSDSE